MTDATLCTTNESSCCENESNGKQNEQRAVYRPHVDVVDSADKLTFYVEMPGVNENGVDVTIEDQVLSIRGTVSVPESTEGQHAQFEYGVGDYERSFKIAVDIDRDKVDARIKDGLLTLDLPKVKPAGATKVAIKAG